MRQRIRVAALCLGILAGAYTGWSLWRYPHTRITDRDLLREAVTEWKRAGKPGYGPDGQILEQQAGQGYYEDAAATAHLYKTGDEVRWAVVEIAKIRAENGDAQGAKAEIQNLHGSSLGEQATRTIALVQAHRGDFDGALATAAEIHAEDDVLTILGQRQLESGNFEAALETSERMSLESAAQFYYEVGDALRLRHEQKRVRELSSRLHDAKYAADFRQIVPFTLRDPGPIETVKATPCDVAAIYATEGKFKEADAVIEQNRCTDVGFVATAQYEVDPTGAERLLEKATDSVDKSTGLNALVEAAAQKGNVADALRFLDRLERISMVHVQEKAVRAVARAWTIKSGPNEVHDWAHSRPTWQERTWALIGMAEALGHSRLGN